MRHQSLFLSCYCEAQTFCQPLIGIPHESRLESPFFDLLCNFFIRQIISFCQFLIECIQIHACSERVCKGNTIVVYIILSLSGNLRDLVERSCQVIDHGAPLHFLSTRTGQSASVCFSHFIQLLSQCRGRIPWINCFFTSSDSIYTIFSTRH